MVLTSQTIPDDTPHKTQSHFCYLCSIGLSKQGSLFWMSKRFKLSTETQRSQQLSCVYRTDFSISTAWIDTFTSQELLIGPARVWELKRWIDKVEKWRAIEIHNRLLKRFGVFSCGPFSWRLCSGWISYSKHDSKHGGVGYSRAFQIYMALTLDL